MENLEERKIFEIVSGSNLYGTNTESSDKDFVGVMIGDDNTYFGLEHVEEIDLSIKSKGEDGKNTKEAVDRTFYELRKFVALALQNNPNVLEILFVNDPNIVFQNDIGKALRAQRHLFPWRGCKQRFLGYAFSQKHKMVIRTDHYYELNNAYEFFIQILHDTPDRVSNLLLAEYRTSSVPFLRFSKGTSCQVGDLSFDVSRKIKDVVSMLKDRLDKITNRSGLMEKYGYDTKFASHLIRLMLEGKELLQTGELQFPLKEKSFILDVKLGKYKITDVLKYSEQFENEIVDLEKTSILPARPRYNEVNDFLIKTLKNTLLQTK
jgi:hypothetical protein